MQEVMYYCYYCSDEGWTWGKGGNKVPCPDNCLRGREWKANEKDGK